MEMNSSFSEKEMLPPSLTTDLTANDSASVWRRKKLLYQRNKVLDRFLERI
jgi:hypothetical protein